MKSATINIQARGTLSPTQYDPTVVPSTINRASRLYGTACCVALLFASLSQADELLFPNSDFESGTLAHWTASGDAFAHQPTKGDNPAARGRESAAMQGEFWIGGFEKHTKTIGKPGETAGDELTGTLLSDAFTIKEPFITFRVGGGHLPGQLAIKLLLGGGIVDMGTGVDSETMEVRSIDVRKHIGEQGRIQIVDQAKGGWGHLNVDDFRGTSKSMSSRRMEFHFTDNISPSAYPDETYDQPLRPQFHFCSKRNWLNDPNGMVYDGKLYHLFFQHNPKATVWGNMTWGHATSPDMIHWTQHDHKLLPYSVDGKAGTIFSGTAVIDHNNSLGKQVGETKTIVAFYTFATKPLFYQAMAYSTDGGKSFTYWNEGRPVVDNQGFDKEERDPKVFWHEPSKQWVMALWVSRGPGRVRWFTSTNLTEWKVASTLNKEWAFECMDVVFLPVDQDPAKMKCLIYDASFDYEIGTFDGREFKSETPPLINMRGDFYAAQSFNQAPNGRVVQVGWMRHNFNFAPRFKVPHNLQMSFPCELSLRTTDAGPRLFVWPISEIKTLVTKSHAQKNMKLADGVNALADITGLDLVDLDIEFEPGTAKEIVFDLPRVTLRYDVAKQELSHMGVDDHGKPTKQITLEKLNPRSGKVKLRLLIDRLSVEAFAHEGEFFSAYYLHPEAGPATTGIRAVGGDATINHLELRELKSSWK